MLSIPVNISDPNSNGKCIYKLQFRKGNVLFEENAKPDRETVLTCFMKSCLANRKVCETATFMRNFPSCRDASCRIPLWRPKPRFRKVILSDNKKALESFIDICWDHHEDVQFRIFLVLAKSMPTLYERLSRSYPRLKHILNQQISSASINAIFKMPLPCARAQLFFITSHLGLLFLLLFLVWPVLIFLYALQFLLRRGWNVVSMSTFYFFVSLASRLYQALHHVPGEDGYSRLYSLGTDVNLDELEKDFMTRNDRPKFHALGTPTFVISYKHYAGNREDPEDNGRISKEDIKAIAALIKNIGPGKVRFWIDTKLPTTTDSSMERWLWRGAHLYSLHMTFFCPSAVKHVNDSFWIGQEAAMSLTGIGATYISQNGDVVLKYARPKEELYHWVLSSLFHPGEMKGLSNEDVETYACWMLSSFQGRSGPTMFNDVGEVKGSLNFTTYINLVTAVVLHYGEFEIRPSESGGCWRSSADLFTPSCLSHICCEKYSNTCFYESGSFYTVFFVDSLSLVRVERQDSILVMQLDFTAPFFFRAANPIIRKRFRLLDSVAVEDSRYVNDDLFSRFWR